MYFVLILLFRVLCDGCDSECVTLSPFGDVFTGPTGEVIMLFEPLGCDNENLGNFGVNDFVVSESGKVVTLRGSEHDYNIISHSIFAHCLVVLIDMSHSTYRKRDIIARAVKDLVENLEEGRWLTIYGFDLGKNIQVIYSLEKKSKASDFSDLYEKITKFDGDTSATNLYSAILQSVEVLRSAMSKIGCTTLPPAFDSPSFNVGSVVIFSDGVNTIERGISQAQVVKDVKVIFGNVKSSVKLFTVGLGNHSEGLKFMKEIGNEYKHVSEVEGLISVFGEVGNGRVYIFAYCSPSRSEKEQEVIVEVKPTRKCGNKINVPVKGKYFPNTKFEGACLVNEERMTKLLTEKKGKRCGGRSGRWSGAMGKGISYVGLMLILILVVLV